MRKRLLALILTSILTACGSPTEGPESPWQSIEGRDEQPRTGRIVRRPVYRAQVPSDWTRRDPEENTSIYDSTLPNVEFQIGTSIHLHVHNFPSDRLDERIPPGAQVARWQRQLTQLSEEPLTQGVAWGGFSGLYFEAQGQLKGQEQRVMAWALQLPPEHFQALLLPGTPDEERFFRQMRADVTLKAVGDPEEMLHHREALHRFADSFELIQAIPGGS